MSSLKSSCAKITKEFCRIRKYIFILSKVMPQNLTSSASQIHKSPSKKISFEHLHPFQVLSISCLEINKNACNQILFINNVINDYRWRTSLPLRHRLSQKPLSWGKSLHWRNWPNSFKRQFISREKKWGNPLHRYLVSVKTRLRCEKNQYTIPGVCSVLRFV